MNQTPNQPFGSEPENDLSTDLDSDSSEFRERSAKFRTGEVLADGQSLSAPNRSPRRSRSKPQLSPQILAVALALATIPPLAIATATYFSHKSIQQKIIPTAIDPTVAQERLERETNYLLLTSWLTALTAGTIAFWTVKKNISPVLDAAAISSMLVRRLRIQQLSSAAPASGKNVLSNLAENMQKLGQRLPDLLSKQESAHDMLQTINKVTTGLRNAASAEDIVKKTADLARESFHADRAVIFRYDRYPQGTFIAEGISAGSPRLLWSTIDNYSVADNSPKSTNYASVVAIDDTQATNLSDEEIAFYQQIGVKAILSAPIYHHNQLFGLISVHQCHADRFWQPLELDLLAQIANQVGLALESVENVEKYAEKSNIADIFIKTTQLIRSSLDEAEVLNASVEAVRKVIGSERVIVYGFDENWYGTVLAESMSPGHPRMLWAGIKDPCFAEGFVDRYQAGRIKATNNIYEENLGECYIQQLEAFEVKANLVAPILKDGLLFGLLIAHQCSAPREWQSWEIDWFAQIATQIGYALDHARLLKKIELEGQRSHLLTQLVRRIRSSMDFEEILKTSVSETRKAIAADRVMIVILRADGSGDIAVESIAPGLPRASAHKLQPSWISEPLRQAYQRGQVIATDDVYASQFNNEQVQLLQRLGIKSSLSAPILVKKDNLFALLVAHHCTQSHQWESQEIEMFAQIAAQIGYALEPVQVIQGLEAEYQSAATTSAEQRRKLDIVQQQLHNILGGIEDLARDFRDPSPQDLEIVTATYKKIQTLATLSQKIVNAAEQTKIREQHIHEMVQAQLTALYSLQAQNSVLRDTDNQAAQTVQQIQLPVDRLSQTIELISQIANHLKLQSVNVALEVSRYGKEGQKLREIAEKVMSYLRELEVDLQEVKPLLENIHSQSQTAAIALHTSSETALISGQLLTATQQEFDRILTVTQEIGTLANGILQSAIEQNTSLESASENALALAQSVSHKTRPSEAIAQFSDRLKSLISLSEDKT